MQYPSSPQTACPEFMRLLDLVEGRLPDGDAETVSLHVASCDACDEKLERIEDQSDVLVQSLASLPATEEDEQSFRELQALLLASPESFSSGSDSLSATILRDLASQSHESLAGASDSLAPLETTLPFRLGNYDLLELIGQGAHGAVFRAKHLRLDRQVAIKLLLRARGVYVEEFLNEMRIVGKLNHPHIVRATDAGEMDGIYFLAMDYVPGIDVTTLLRRSGQLTVADACEIARQSAIGLACAHEHKLVHRDVKTSNLLFASNGVVKLLDLGLATIPTSTSSTSSLVDERSGVTSVASPRLDGARGTADYMAPEQWIEASQVTEKADLYSLGCTLFKLLAGQTPFRSLPEGVESKQAAHETSPPPKLSEFRNDIPAGVENLVRRLLAKSPGDRPMSAELVAKQLLQYSDTADLPLLVRRHCAELEPMPQPKHLRPNSITQKARRLAARVPRRTWIGGAAALTAAATVYLVTRDPIKKPMLQTDAWRDLLATRTFKSIKLGEEYGSPTVLRPSEQAISITADELSLLQLGSPMPTPLRWNTEFRFKTNIAEPESSEQEPKPAEQTGSGIFFGLRKKDSENLAFHALEIWRGANTAMLLWMEYSQPDLSDPLALAETMIPFPASNSKAKLGISLGLSGFPRIFFNGEMLPQAKWKLALEARELLSMSTSRVAELYAGQIGVIHHHGITTIESSKLMYLES